MREVFEAWWPLAASWLLMGFELPAVSAVMARLPDPTVSLAAYGGVVFPLSLLIEAPIIMLLTASTALSKDLPSYRFVRRFMFTAGLLLTGLHALVAFTPLYDIVVGGLIRPPADILGPARTGLMIMTPWTISIAYRRFQQGLLIRFGRSRDVGTGTAVRLSTNVIVLGIGWAIGSVPGIVVGTTAVALGVIAEAVYAGVRAHPVIRGPLAAAPLVPVPLSAARFLHFYGPLLITPILLFFSMPLASAAMSRMPRPLESLAAWPVVNGFVFTLRSVSFALSEVTISLLDRPGMILVLRRFTAWLSLALTGVLVLVAATPIARVWFADVSALPAPLVPLSITALWLALLLPGLTAWQSLYQGMVVHAHRTRAVTESMLLFLGVYGGALAAGIALQRYAGLHVTLVAFVVGGAVQIAWLLFRVNQGVPATARQVAEPALPA